MVRPTGSVGGLALLAALTALALWLRRRRGQRAAGAPDKPAGPTPGPCSSGTLHTGEPSARTLGLAGADSCSLMSTELTVDVAAKRTQLWVLLLSFGARMGPVRWRWGRVVSHVEARGHLRGTWRTQ